MQQEFKSLTSFYLEDSETDLSELYMALQYEQKEVFIETYQKLLLTLPSYHDLKSENSYHVFFLGICVWLKNEYEIISNREEGMGRCDLILKAKKVNLPSYIFEFKYVTSKTVCLKDMAIQAIQQIKEKQYDVDISGGVIYIGMAHRHKEVEIIWQKAN